MNAFRLYTSMLLISLSTICSAQVLHVNELGEVRESGQLGNIEPTGRLSYIDDTSIIYSADLGITWNELETPFRLRENTGTIYVTSYQGLSNGNYILHTSSTMHYIDNGEWTLLTINGDSIFDEGPYIIDDQALIIKDDGLYVYDDNTKEVVLQAQLAPYCCSRIELFQNHFLLRTTSNQHEIWTNDFQILSTIDFVKFGVSAYITQEGYVIKQERTHDQNGVFGSLISISRDGGSTFTELYSNESEEYIFIGEIGGRLYFRGWITQPEAWSNGHFQSRVGYLDLTTGEIAQVQDGLNFTRYYSRGHLPVIFENDLYLNIGSAIVLYPGGDLDNRQINTGSIKTAQPITKIRVSESGIYYALTNAFLYKSTDNGSTWENLLDFNSVTE